MNTQGPPSAGNQGELHTVGEVAALARVTVRTLHHYDRIGLLVPSRRAENGYRLYDYADLERLRQILLLRELGFGLDSIGQMVDAAAYDRRRALIAQRELLRERQRRTEKIIRGVDSALAAMEGERPMEKTKMFEGLEDFDHERYEDEARERWGKTDAYKESARRTRHYTRDDWTRIKGEAEDVMTRLAALAGRGSPGREQGGKGTRRGAPLPHRPLVLPLQPRDARGAGRHVRRGSAVCGPLRAARGGARGLLQGGDPGERRAAESHEVAVRALQRSPTRPGS